jgi:membrane protein DedA with SNARE-associated domain/rhodanese-related sulfurtransferase
MTNSELTYTGVLFAVLANQLCLPVPSCAFLMAAGALSAHGKMHPAVVVLLAVLGCLMGDGVWFCFGRKWGSKAVRLICRFAADPRTCSQKARAKFRRYGLRLLCGSKFVPGLDGVMPPLAGAEGVSVAAFLALDSIGSALWSSSYVGLGYLFSNELEVAIHWAQHFGTALGVAIGVPAGLYAAWRGLTLLQMIRQLRLRRISAPMLARKLKSKSKLAVVDLSNFEEETDSQSGEAIPGAFRVEPTVLRKSPQIHIPDDVKVILYSSSGSDTVSARAAVALKRIGVDNVWVLEGGLQAWRDQGLPVAQCLAVPEIVAERLGVRLPEQSPARMDGTVHCTPVHPDRDLQVPPVVNEC